MVAYSELNEEIVEKNFNTVFSTHNSRSPPMLSRITKDQYIVLLHTSGIDYIELG